MQIHSSKRRLHAKGLFRLLVLAFLFPFVLCADQIIYDNVLENGWQNWSWATVNFSSASPNPVHSSPYAISVSCGANQALYLHNPYGASLYTNLTFWINAGSGGQPLKVQATVSGGALTNNYAFAAPAGGWQLITVPLSVLGVTNQPNTDGFWVQNNSSAQLATFYVDDISLVTNAITAGTNTTIAITVDAQAGRHAISPMIYGTAFASSNQLSDLNFTMNRSGGNSETRYNWQLNAHNHAADWYFESIADDGPTNAGATADAFVATSKNGGAQPMLTIPMIGWMPRLGPTRGKLWSYSTNKYGPQTDSDIHNAPYNNPDAGNGISITNTTRITWNDPNEANFPTNVAFQQGYVQHLMNQWGTSTNGGVRYYLMDNEESIWQGTHQDVHPVGPTMQEIRDDFFTYASMVKSNDPNALVCGFEEWGWNGYIYSGYDQQNPGFTDRAANGGWDYMPWLLDQIHQHDLGTGYRLLDYFTLHCYPQEGNVSGTDVSPSTELLRNQTTRVFWDSNYVDPSWINKVIMLIPRMRSWVATNYPGTMTGITEYNWGAETNINGATAQADILGIFGREGLDLATRWTTPATGSPTYKAMKIYRNYDGNKSVFGDTSVQTTAPNPDVLSAFGAVRTSDGALTLMVINKDINNASPILASVANFNAVGTAQRWQLTANNLITRLSDIPLASGVLNDTLPSQSITLYVLPATTSFNLQVDKSSPPGQLGIWLNGQAGKTYILQSSADLVHWSAVDTNQLVSNSFEFFVPITNATQMLYRGNLGGP